MMTQMVKNLPTIWETLVRSLGWEDPLEMGMATHSSILAWKNPLERGAWWATVHGVAKSDMTEQLTHYFFFIFFKLILFIYLFLLYNIVLVLPYINMHPPRVIM